MPVMEQNTLWIKHIEPILEDVAFIFRMRGFDHRTCSSAMLCPVLVKLGGIAYLEFIESAKRSKIAIICQR